MFRLPTSATRTRPAARLLICPPDPLLAPQGLLARLAAWWAGTGDNPRPARVHARLQSARDDFFDALVDVRGARAEVLRATVMQARGLRELWYLRPRVFDAVTLQFDQHEADRRLLALNRHFPTRAPRSGFTPLD